MNTSLRMLNYLIPLVTDSVEINFNLITLSPILYLLITDKVIRWVFLDDFGY